MRVLQRSQTPTVWRYDSRFSSWSCSLQPREDALVGLLLRQPGEVARLVVHPAVGADHGQLRQAVVAPDLVVESDRARA